MSTTSAQIIEFKNGGSWRILKSYAQGIFRAIEPQTGPISKRMGGGTRLMLAYEHRISHDIDIFIGDTQYYNYLNPDLGNIPAGFAGYDVNPGSIKLIYPEGEIDFIFSPTMLPELAAERSGLTSFDLDPVQEVLFKKLYFRGASITARDLFDWWSVAHIDPAKFPSEQAMGILGPVRVAQLRVGISHWMSAEFLLYHGRKSPPRTSLRIKMLSSGRYGRPRLSLFHGRLAPCCRWGRVKRLRLQPKNTRVNRLHRAVGRQ